MTIVLVKTTASLSWCNISRSSLNKDYFPVVHEMQVDISLKLFKLFWYNTESVVRY